MLGSLREKTYQLADNVSKRTGTGISVQPRIYLRPAKMSPRILNTIESSAKMLGLSLRRMQSGAGHDTMIMNQLTETGMIFVPSKGGKSHAPS